MSYPQRRVWLAIFAAVVTFALLEITKAPFFSSQSSFASFVATVVAVEALAIFASRYAFCLTEIQELTF
jgi:hypothetical protein